jgi:hypothetical protein
MSTELCTVCGSDKATTVEKDDQKDTLCYVCSGWFLVECMRRTGFGNTVVIVAAPEEEEPQFVVGRKNSMEPVN